MKKNKIKGFTLAEVLITLGIIGVVAAMTLPTIIQKQREKVIITSLKKAYSSINQAFLMATQTDPIENWDLGKEVASIDGANHLMEKFAPYMKTIKTCRVNEYTNCSPDIGYKMLNGQAADSSHSRTSKIILANGGIISFYIYSPECKIPWGTSKPLKNICASIGIDINGIKSPNQIGIDHFNFLLTKYGVVPTGSAQQTYAFTFDIACRDKTKGQIPGWGNNGNGCTAWVIYNENMDYLHCDNLSWNGKKKCSK